MNEIVDMHTKRKVKLAKLKAKLKLDCLDEFDCDIEFDEQLAEELNIIKKRIRIRKKNGTDNS